MDLKKVVDERLLEFSKASDWFSELCFCILTGNSKAKTALLIEKELYGSGYRNLSFEEIRDVIIRNKHRFHNNKARFIVEAREFLDIKDRLKGLSSFDAREFLVKNVNGLGYKEASHFLRNVGYTDLAILDRHIINLMVEKKMIKRPKSLTPKIYLAIEKKFRKLAETKKMSLAELDLHMWYEKTGVVLK